MTIQSSCGGAIFQTWVPGFVGGAVHRSSGHSRAPLIKGGTSRSGPMRPPLHPTVLRHLQAVQRSTRVGLHSLLRGKNTDVRSASTVYRWQRSLAEQLLVVPNVSVELLGLRHAHVFLTTPLGNIDCPFAVEAAWITADFCQEVLYLHCLVPVAHVTAFTTSMAGGTIVWSSSGWQQILPSDEEILLPIPAGAVAPSDLVCQPPFLLPAFM